MLGEKVFLDELLPPNHLPHEGSHELAPVLVPGVLLVLEESLWPAFSGVLDISELSPGCGPFQDLSYGACIEQSCAAIWSTHMSSSDHLLADRYESVSNLHRTLSRVSELLPLFHTAYNLTIGHADFLVDDICEQGSTSHMPAHRIGETRPNQLL